MTAKTSAASATVCASGPFSLIPPQESVPIWAGITARPGLIPNRPVLAAGIRIDPIPSLPCATGTMPLATAAALPPEEPPGVRSSAHGLRVVPNVESHVAHRHNSGKIGRAHV